MASVFDNYRTLPGFLSEFKDGGLQAKTDVAAPTTKSVLILGTAVDGPIMDPVAVDPGTVELVFGPGVTPKGAPNGSTVIKAFEEAYQAGARDIRIMRISGNEASGQVATASRTITSDVPKTDNLGNAAGNKVISFDLNQYTIDVNSVTVVADGVNLPASAFTVTQGVASTTYAKVNLKVDVTNAEASCLITYSYGTAPATTVTENGKVGAGGAITYYIATGNDKTATLSDTPKATPKVYADGAEIAAAGLTIAGTSVTVKSGYAKKGQLLEAVYVTSKAVTDTPIIKLKSIFGGTVYNQSKVGVRDDNGVRKLYITKPESKKGQIAEKPLEFSTADYPTLALLAQAINSSVDNHLLHADVAKTFANVDATTLVLQADIALVGGSDGTGLAKQDLYDKLGGTRDVNGNVLTYGAYQLLENYTVDFIVPTGVYSDDVLAGKYDNFAAQLGLACAVISFRNHTCHGVIATSSSDEAGLQAVQQQVDKLLAVPNNFFMRDRQGNILKDEDGDNIDLGRFISVVAGPDVIFSGQRLGTYAENSAAGYAGYVSFIPAQSSPTNKAQAHAKDLRFTYSNAQLDKLTAARYVTFKTKRNGTQIAICDAPTAAQPQSDYRRLTTIRVTSEAVNVLRNVCDPYLGEPNEKPQRNAMTAAISKALDQLIQDGVIMGYDFNIVVTPQMEMLGEAVIELTLVPPQELRKVTTIVSLRSSQ